MDNQTFPGFEHAAEELSAYAFCIDVFIISLKNKQVIRHRTPDAAAFRAWLDALGVRDITNETGSLIINHYHKMK
jgi:hypothetical protein